MRCSFLFKQPNKEQRNSHDLYRPDANLSCLQKSAYYSGINILNNLPYTFKSYKQKGAIVAALKRCLNTHSFHSVDEFLVFKNDSFLSLNSRNG
jgi:hypothetical protein